MAGKWSPGCRTRLPEEAWGAHSPRCRVTWILKIKWASVTPAGLPGRSGPNQRDLHAPFPSPMSDMILSTRIVTRTALLPDICKVAVVWDAPPYRDCDGTPSFTVSIYNTDAIIVGIFNLCPKMKFFTYVLVQSAPVSSPPVFSKTITYDMSRTGPAEPSRSTRITTLRISVTAIGGGPGTRICIHWAPARSTQPTARPVNSSRLRASLQNLSIVDSWHPVECYRFPTGVFIYAGRQSNAHNNFELL